jgi:hypothetical protein
MSSDVLTPVRYSSLVREFDFEGDRMKILVTGATGFIGAAVAAVAATP